MALLSLLTLQTFAAPAFACVDVSCMLESIVDSQYFASQEDDRIVNGKTNGVPNVTEDGGLCGPTAAHILLTALNRLQGFQSNQDSVSEILRLTSIATEITGYDARNGLYTKDLVKLIQHEAKTWGLDLRFENKKAKPANFKGISSNPLFILGSSVYSKVTQAPKPEWDHFSVGFDYDPASETLKIVDPLWPKVIVHARLQKTVDPDEPNENVYQIIYDQDLKGYPEKPLIFFTSLTVVDSL